MIGVIVDKCNCWLEIFVDVVIEMLMWLFLRLICEMSLIFEIKFIGCVL